MNLRPPSAIETPAGALDSVLLKHRLWLESNGQPSSRAALPVCDLRGADLRECDLRLADLAMADLSGADLSHARLNGASLVAANLRHARLCEANLDDFNPAANSGDGAPSAVQSHAATALDGVDFTGADLTLARFPRRFNFQDAILQSLRAARHARLFATGLGVLLVFLVFQIGAIRDAQLLLPGGDLPGVSYFGILPPNLVLLGTAIVAAMLYGFWILKPLRKLCPARGQLAARLPDSSAIDGNREFWPLNMLAAQWMPLSLEDRHGWRDKLPVWITLAALFGALPAVAILAWWRYLAVHEWPSSALLIATAAAAVGFAFYGWSSSSQTLGGPRRGSSGLADTTQEPRPLPRALAASAISAGVLGVLSFGAIEHRFAAYLAARVEITFQNLSESPPGMVEANTAAMRGPNLAGRNLRFARISYSELPKANLRNARLDHAAITDCDLRHADLSGASLRNAALFASNLEGAVLNGTDLRGGTLLCAKGLEPAQLAAAQTDAATTLPDGSSGPFRPGANTLAVNAEACAHWEPGSAPPVPSELLLPPTEFSQTAAPPGAGISGKTSTPTEPDLSPIEPLGSSRKRTTPAPAN